MKKTGKPILLLLLLLILAAALPGYLLLFQSGDTVLPGVSVADVPLGGMTEAEAAEALQPLCGEEEVFTLHLPSGETLTRSLRTLGLSPDSAVLAARFVKLGRSGSFSEDLHTIVSAFLGKLKLQEAEAAGLDEEVLSALATEAAAKASAAPTEPVVFIDGSELRITRGSAGSRAEAAQLLEDLRTALEAGARDYIVHTAVVPPTEPDPAAIHDKVCCAPVDAGFTAEGGVSPEKYGLEFDVSAAEELLAAAAEGETVVIPLCSVAPAVCAAELQPLLFRDLLAAQSAGLTDNEVRTNNIRLAAASIDGRILLPGEEFSYNASLGERTEALGYGAAPAYSYGKVVTEVGGGICQLSSQLYMCCLKADEKILERTNHAYYQSYVPYGFDATVSWGGPDFRFRNSGSYPLRIGAWIEDGTLRVELWGTKESEGHIELSYEIEETLPAGVCYEETEELQPGVRQISDYGRDGMKVRSYRLRYDAGGRLQEKTEIALSEYAVRDQVILVGKEKTEEAP